MLKFFKTSLFKDTIKTIKKSMSRFVAIIIMTGLSSAVFIGLQSGVPNLKKMIVVKAKEFNMHDVKIFSYTGIREKDKNIINNLENVANIEYQNEAIFNLKNENYTIKIFSKTDEIDTNIVKMGRLPENDKEIALDYLHYKNFGNNINQYLEFENKEIEDKKILKNQKLKIVGYVESVQYMSDTKMNSSQGDYFGVVKKEIFDKKYPDNALIKLKSVDGKDYSSKEYKINETKNIEKIEDLFSLRPDEVKREIQKDATKEIDDAKQKIVEAREEINDAQAKLKKSKMDLDSADNEIKDGELELKNSKDKLDSAKREIENGYKEYNENLEKFNQEIDQAFDKINFGENEVNNGFKKIKENDDKYQSGLKEYNLGLSKIQENKKKIENGLKELQINEEKLSEKLTEFDKQKNLIKENLNLVVKSITDIEDKIPEGITEEIAKAQSNKQLLDLFSKLKDLTSQKNKLESSLKEIEKGITEINSKLKLIEKKRVEINNNSNLLIDEEKKLSQIKKELDNAKNEIKNGKDELVQRSEELKKSKYLLKTKQNDGKIELENAKQKLESAKLEYEDGLAKYEAGVKDIEEAKEKYKDGLKEYEEGNLKFEKEKSDADKKILDAENKIKNAEEDIKKLEVPSYNIQGKYGNTIFYRYIDQASSLNSMSYIFSTLFYLVAILVTLTTVLRMVEIERTQIGTLKALGYSKLMIMTKYMLYGIMASFIGSILGVYIGRYVIMPPIVKAYTTSTIITGIPKVFEYDKAIFIVLITIVLIAFTVYFTVNKELKNNAASLMRPKPPKKAKRTILENIPFIWNRMSFLNKVTARNLLRNKFRMFITIMGVAGSFGLMAMGFGIKTSIDNVGPKQFNEIYKYNIQIIHNDFGNDKEKLKQYVDEFSEEKIDIIYKSGTIKTPQGFREDIGIVATDNVDELHNFISLRDRKSKEKFSLVEDKVIVSEKLAKTQKLKIGDYLVFKDINGVDRKIQISDITEQYFNHSIYMTKKTYNKLTEESASENSYIIKLKENSEKTILDIRNKVSNLNSVSAFISVSDLKDVLNDLSESLNSVIVLVIGVSALLALVVLYNLTDINISERFREISTIKVLGFKPVEVVSYIFKENIILTFIGVIIGIGVAKLMHNIIVHYLSPGAFLFDPKMMLENFIFATILILIFTLIVMFLAKRNMDKIDMVESLKAVE